MTEHFIVLSGGTLVCRYIVSLNLDSNSGCLFVVSEYTDRLSSVKLYQSWRQCFLVFAHGKCFFGITPCFSQVGRAFVYRLMPLWRLLLLEHRGYRNREMMHGDVDVIPYGYRDSICFA